MTLLLPVTWAGTVVPPYAGAGVTLGHSESPHGPRRCGASSFPAPAAWHPSRGALEWSAAEWAKSSGRCGSPTYCVVNSTCSFVDATLTLPFPTPRTSGSSQIVVRWSLRANLSWNLSLRPCPAPVLTNGTGYQTCSAEVDEYLSTQLFNLRDLTTNRTIAPGGSGPFPSIALAVGRFHSESCVSNTCRSTELRQGPLAGERSVALSGTVDFNGTSLNGSDRYALYLDLWGGMSIRLASSGRSWTADVQASEDLASPGLGLRIVSISVR